VWVNGHNRINAKRDEDDGFEIDVCLECEDSNGEKYQSNTWKVIVHPKCSTVYTLISDPPADPMIPYSSTGTYNLIPSGYSSIWTRIVDPKFSIPGNVCPITGCKIYEKDKCGDDNK
jgi:hypothetical protein